MSNNYKTDGGVKVSGDRFGAAAHLLKAQSPRGPVVLFASSSDGDQRSIIGGVANLPKVGSIPASDAGEALNNLYLLLLTRWKMRRRPSSPDRAASIESTPG
jgi:hypothetical protein